MQTSGSPRKTRVVNLVVGVPFLSCAVCGVVGKALEGGAREFWIAFASLLASPLVWLCALIVFAPQIFAINEEKLVKRILSLEPGETVVFIDWLHPFEGAMLGSAALVVSDRRALLVRHSGNVLRQVPRDSIASAYLDTSEAGARRGYSTLHLVGSHPETPGMTVKWVTGGERLLEHLRTQAPIPAIESPHV